MNYQMIVKLARHGVFYRDEEDAFSSEVMKRAQILYYSKWVQLRSTTIRQILSGHIRQSDSPIIHAVTLANNISRRSLEFITPPPVAVDNDEDEDYNNEYNNEDNAYDPDDPVHHYNYDDEDEDDDYARRYSDDEYDYDYSTDI